MAIEPPGHLLFRKNGSVFFFFVFAVLMVNCSAHSVEKKTSTGGEIQVLNACGKSKAALQMRNFLMEKGYDVIEMGDGPNWSFNKTIIALRNPYWMGGTSLSQVLNTKNLILLHNPATMVDATVYVGKDFEELINHEKP